MRMLFATTALVAASAAGAAHAQDADLTVLLAGPLVAGGAR